MTDRDHFAAAALTGLVASEGADSSVMGPWCCRAFAWADAMLRERERTSVGVAGMDPVTDRKSAAACRACAGPCSQTFDSSSTTDQERFNAAVMNWISEASAFLFHDVAKCEGGKKIISDACDRCWVAYGKQSTDSGESLSGSLPADLRDRVSPSENDKNLDHTQPTLTDDEIAAIKRALERASNA